MIIKINEQLKQILIYNNNDYMHTVFFLYDLMKETDNQLEVFINEKLVIIINKLTNKIILEKEA